MRDQVMANQEENYLRKSRSVKANLKSFVSGKDDAEGMMDAEKPLAELFLETTVLFGDVSDGFWLQLAFTYTVQSESIRI